MCCCFAIFVTVPAPNIRDLKIHVTPFPCTGTGKLAVHVAMNTGRLLLNYLGETGRLLYKMVSPLSHLGKNGCFLQNYELNMFAYPYS